MGGSIVAVGTGYLGAGCRVLPQPATLALPVGAVFRCIAWPGSASAKATAGQVGEPAPPIPGPSVLIAPRAPVLLSS